MFREEPIHRWTDGALDAGADRVAVEEPLEVRCAGASLTVTMRTPGHDAELVAGLLLSEGIVKSRSDLIAVVPRGGQGNVVEVLLAPGVRVDPARMVRHIASSASCGLCGLASIEAVHRHFEPVRSDLRVAASLLLELPEKLRAAQALFGRTGGVHAAAVFDGRGGLVAAREDVGRHNAVDKVLGRGLLDGLLPFDEHVLLVSGRVSFEIVQKALAGRLPIVAAVSAPTSLAVECARASGQTLIGFLREGRLNVYAGAERVLTAREPGAPT